MKLDPRVPIYVAAAAALVIGALAYGAMEEESDHEEHGLLAGDVVMVAAVGGVLAIVALASFAYLVRQPPGKE